MSSEDLKEKEELSSKEKKRVAAFLKQTKKAFVNKIDQNDDGKFNLEDVSEFADTMGDAAKNGARAFKESVDEKKREMELKSLRPIFADDLDTVEFSMSKFIRVTDRDKKHAESALCEGSVGFYSEQKGMRYINIFTDSVDVFSLSFYPDSSSEFYYIDPSDRDSYICLDEYFSYLKSACVGELQRIAQSLGATHFKVTYKEKQTSFSESEKSGGVSVAGVGGMKGSRSKSEEKYSLIEIAAESSFPGHPPVRPVLKYLQRDPSIQTLIEMRMDDSSPLSNQVFAIKLSSSSGLKESDAVKIDAVLKGMKCSGNTTVASEARNESRRILEYEIDFKTE